MKLSRLLILAATLLRGLAALGAEAEKSGRVGAAYNSYFLVKHSPGYQFALCTTRGKILTHEEYDYLEAMTTCWRMASMVTETLRRTL